MHTTYLAATLLASLLPVTTAIWGSAYGFATGVSEGGSATAAAPSDIAQLKAWLADATPRVILIDKTFNFKGSEGSATGAGCYQSSCTPANGGQTYIGTLSCGGSNMVSTTVTYDVAGTTQLEVASDKTILGVGSAGIIQGKGLRLKGGVKKVIIQNVHFTDINPAHVWGGDGIQLDGNQGVWIDHCKFSKIGRQFFVSHYTASQFTISNTEFDGTTTTSASCNGDHYWTNMFIGPGDLITLDGNYYHDLSGRAPKIGDTDLRVVVQASNNYFYSMKGHGFDIYSGTYALLEGNVFETVTTPITSGSSAGYVYDVPDSSSSSACNAYLGRTCPVNTLSGSGSWPSLKTTSALSTFQSHGSRWMATPIAASGVKAKVLANAWIGKI